MTIQHLETLFTPRSVVLVGASKKPGSVGNTVANNLLTGGFQGDIRFVNPKYREINGTPCLKDVADLPVAPDLAVISTPPATVIGIVNALGARGTRAIVILTAGMKPHEAELRATAKVHDIRIIGPNCLGVLVPGCGLNASFSHRMALKGDLSLLSQSGAVVTTIIDWASSRGIGFSHIMSMGDMVDCSIADMLDHAAGDAGTRAILLYLEGIRDAQTFMSAARAAARVKPVIVIKAGRHDGAARAAISHTGALTGSDIAYDAAFERAGLLRVYDLDEMFAAAETISRVPSSSGNRLAIVTNGGGTGILAADRLEDYGGSLGQLAPDTIRRLDQVLPATWSRGNPIDIIGDAGPQRYREALTIALDDPTTDAVLALYCPTALASGRDVAQAVLDTLEERTEKAVTQKPVLTCWLGGDAATEAREMFTKAGLATFQTPNEAVRGFTHMARYTTAQTALTRTPPDISQRFHPDPDTARRTVTAALEHGKSLLDADDVKAVLKAYDIPVVASAFARTPAEVALKVQTIIDRPDGIDRCVIKIISPDITHKSDIGGVRLNILNGQEGQSAATAMLEAVANRHPEATVDGFSIEPMILRPDARELIIGLADDATFGPIMLFGAGGTAVEVINDKAIALPPLDMALARMLIARTRVYQLMRGYRNIASVDLDAVALTLVKISQLAADIPEIRELDINPLLSDASGVISLDARIVVASCPEAEPLTYNPRFAIHPYPGRLEENYTLKNGTIAKIRPIRPSDERFYETFFRYLSPHDIRMRLFGAIKTYSHEQVAHLTQIDYARAMAFVAIDTDEDALLGVSRLATDPDRETAEFAVIVRTDLKGVGLGWALMNKLISHARAERLKELHGQVLAENTTMLKMCDDLGFDTAASLEDPGIFQVRLALAPDKHVVATQ